MISEIRIRNLRSLKDTGNVQLKKINVLLGTNSSGKSTFLRSFPLLKQSINKDLRNAISWFDASSVDFGDYSTSLNREAKGAPISFEFVLSSPFYSPRYAFYSAYGRLRRIFSENKKLIVRIEYSDDSYGTYISRVRIEDSRNTYQAFAPARNAELVFSLDGIDVKGWNSNIRFGRYIQNQLIPIVDYTQPEDLNDSYRDVRDYYKDRVIQYLRKYCSRRLKKSARLNDVLMGWNSDKHAFLKFLQGKISIQSFSKRATAWTIDSMDFNEVYSRVGSLRIFDYLEVANNEISRYYLNCSYIAPVRAEASRYYRAQGLQVDDIDSYGKNLQEFISSLTTQMQESYKDYCLKVLGVYPIISPLGGQNSILLRSREDEGTNLTDVGFGYSQILPIITKLWYSAQMMTPTGILLMDSMMDTILIEQPELHLHPAMQAKVADALITCATEKILRKRYSSLFKYEGSEMVEQETKDSRIIVETHSPAIINRIGRRIREGRISAEDVTVILFEKNSVDADTTIRQIGFDSEGRLKDWPYGFFDPTD